MSNTRSGRQVKKVGQSENKQSALSSLAKLRKGEGKRTDQYEVNEGKIYLKFEFFKVQLSLNILFAQKLSFCVKIKILSFI